MAAPDERVADLDVAADPAEDLDMGKKRGDVHPGMERSMSGSGPRQVRRACWVIDFAAWENILVSASKAALRYHGEVAQSVERRTENPCVDGSIPSLAIPPFLIQRAPGR